MHPAKHGIKLSAARIRGSLLQAHHAMQLPTDAKRQKYAGMPAAPGAGSQWRPGDVD